MQSVFITRRILQFSPDVRASHRWLRFSKIDDGAVFVVIYWREIFFWACVLTRRFWCQFLWRA